MTLYQPESEQFRRELGSPQFIQDDRTGVTYAVRTFNRDRVDQHPVVLNLPFGLNGTDRLGIAVLSAYAQHIERPIITMDMAGAGETSPPGWRWGWGSLASVGRAAASETRVLRKMDVTQASFVGLCLGGRLAYEKAKAFGGNAEKLVTISSIGYSALSFRELYQRWHNRDEYSKARAVSRNAIQSLNLGQVWRHEVKEASLEGRASIIFSVLGATAAMSASVSNLNDLAPNTEVSAITVPNDILADEDAHRKAIAARNEQHPDTAQLIVLNTHQGHAFTTYNAPAMAQLTNALLSS